MQLSTEQVLRGILAKPPQEQAFLTQCAKVAGFLPLVPSVAPPLALRQLHPKQAEFVNNPAKRRVVRAGRRGGKTVGVAQLAVRAFAEGRRVLYATPTEDQIKRFWYEVKLALQARLDANILYKNETEHVIEVPGTLNRLRAKTAWNADTLRGDYADLLILDEYQLMNEDAWELVGAPMLLDNNGDAVFVYTPPSIRAAQSKARDKMHAAKLFKRAIADDSGRWAAFHFSSHDNPHLSTEALDEITQDMTQAAIEQEILALDRDELPGALWTRDLLTRGRKACDPFPLFTRTAVALDPAATSSAAADEMGIVAGGIMHDGHGAVIEDASMRGTPTLCCRRAIQVYDRLGAGLLVAEVNNGGEWIETVLRLTAADMHLKGERATADIKYKAVHASQNKATRAEPVAGLYEHGRIHHLGLFPALEDQLCTWIPGMPSPDRLDANVWLWTALLVKQHAGVVW